MVTQAPPDRSRARILNLRVTDEELAKAHELAESEGLSVSGLIRQFLLREHRARFGDVRQTKRTKGKK
jgi:hypothetical protein